MKRQARVIAYYLPQFHPIPENDKWWGKGFTEWVNVAKAKPLFKGHSQPRIPADLGFYDLRRSEIREQQAELARDAGIEGFCYWHYWFGNGRRLLERPFCEVLKSGKPDFPFCLGWANHSWTNKSWKVGQRFVKEQVLMEQCYPGKHEFEMHFHAILSAFKDSRYIKVDGKPLFVIFNPLGIPRPKEFIAIWQNLAIQNGLDGIYFVGITQNMLGLQDKSFKNGNGKRKSNNVKDIYQNILDNGFDAVNSRGVLRAELMTKGHVQRYSKKIVNKVLGNVSVDRYKYADIIKHLFVEEDRWQNVHPTIIPNWDRSPRSGKQALIWYKSSPELFKVHIEEALKIIMEKDKEKRIIFLQSWNEWAEGNYVEPDIEFGHGYLNAIKQCIITP